MAEIADVVRLELPTKIGGQSVNLNVYRNLHYRQKNNMKVQFSKLIMDKVMRIVPIEGRFKLRYFITAASNRRFDIMNVVSIVDKFFCDTMVDVGIIEDDSFNQLVGVSVEFMGVEKLLTDTMVEVEIVRLVDDGV